MSFIRNSIFVPLYRRLSYANLSNTRMFTYVANRLISCTKIPRELEWFVSCSIYREYSDSNSRTCYSYKAISFLCRCLASNKLVTKDFLVPFRESKYNSYFHIGHFLNDCSICICWSGKFFNTLSSMNLISESIIWSSCKISGSKLFS